MKREKLIQAIEDAARTYELEFQTGYQHQINEQLKNTPTLWLESIEKAKIEGVGEGLITYAIKLIMIDISYGQGLWEPEASWRKMENKAAGICLYIANTECVKSISDVEYTAGQSSITNRGEISMSIKMNVQIPFQNSND